jgi:hypothetical protein
MDLPIRKYNVKKTSSKWLHSEDFSWLRITNPIGWPDGPNWFVTEKITRDEFISRLIKSRYEIFDEII